MFKAKGEERKGLIKGIDKNRRAVVVVVVVGGGRFAIVVWLLLFSYGWRENRKWSCAQFSFPFVLGMRKWRYNVCTRSWVFEKSRRARERALKTRREREKEVMKKKRNKKRD